MRKLTVVATLAVLSLSFLSDASAQLRRRAQVRQTYPTQQYQQNQQYQQYPQTGQPLTAGRYDAGQRVSGPMQGASLTDQQLANWLLVDNRGEIQLARLAQDRAACDDVKKFAKQMIDEHSKMVEQLQRFAGMGRGMQTSQQTQRGEEGEEYAAQGQPGARSPQQRQQFARGQQFREQDSRFPEQGQQFTQQGQQFSQPGQFTQQGQQPGGLNFVRIKQQLGQQCLTSAQQELEQKDGEEFDMCFIGIQIAKHMEMLDTLKVFSRYASPQLDELIEQAEQSTQEHLDHAKELIKDHEGHGSSTSDKSSKSTGHSSTDASSSSDARHDRD